MPHLLDWAPNCISLSTTLGKLRVAALNNCARCRLLAECVSPYQRHWSHLSRAEAERVTIVLSRSIIATTDRLFRVSIQWQCQNSEPGQLEIQIAAENANDMPWSEFDVINLPVTSADGEDCLHIIKTWLHSCDSSHSECELLVQPRECRPKRLLRIEGGGFPKVTLIDNSEKEHAYTALSHCWGESCVLKTLSPSLEEHKTAGIPLSSLTETFRDAVNLTAKLGLRYIWIDSLCIVQDDRDEWSAECPKMGAIYGAVYIVIAASLAANGSYGLYRDRPNFHRVKFHTKAGHLIKAVVRTKVNHDVWKAGEQFWAAPELPLFDRAWAFQERLLARRVCQQHKVHSDRLPALSSVAKLIDMPETLGRCLAGIWEYTLPRNLLWWSKYTDAKLHPESSKATHERKKPSSIPMWSWLSIEGRVSTWGRGPITTVELLGFTYILSDKDAYGACKGASIMLSGKAEYVEIVLHSVPEMAITYAVRRSGVDEYFDFLSDTNPFEFCLEELKGSQIIALQVGISPGNFARYNCLILKFLLGSSAAYERLGIADCGLEWFPSQERRIITLV
ncbi:uncharacterized protein PAC_16331 [Phialocephala subalpina]|uniref:Heterokaryon incompatibility domain-containing protein n=1 Tax=Phialocephala subalpina TaxID=576137 RepID=A0A1L7XMZ1_9HELO|nr:uncharacterized protein PAC_16331 [Phialocephala subalpina]